MPKKPWIINLLFSIYIVSPLGILLVNSLYNYIPIWGVGGILSRLSLVDIVVLVLYPVIATAVFSVRKEGWWIFVVSSLILISLNVFSFIRNPIQSVMNLIIYNVLLFTAAGLLFRREIIAPYFNPRLRWWEADPRFKVDFHCTVHLENKLQADIIDISQQGCYIHLQNVDWDESLIPPSYIPIELRLQHLRLQLNAKVVRWSNHPIPGWGLKFGELKETSKEGLHRLLKQLAELSGHPARKDERRRFQRIHVPQWIHWDEDGISRSGRLKDLSRSGCCIETPVSAFSASMEYDLCLANFDDQKHLQALPIWHNQRNASFYSGLEFCGLDKVDRKYIKHLLRFFKTAGADNRDAGQKLNPFLIEQSLKNTPFPKLYGGKV